MMPTLKTLLPHVDAFLEGVLGISPMFVYTAMEFVVDMVWDSDGIKPLDLSGLKPLIEHLTQGLLPTAGK